MDFKVCPICGDLIKGRSDKKFCDEDCRNSYHNALKSFKSRKFTKADKIKAMLETLDKDTQRLLVWTHLSCLIEQDASKNLVWVMDKIGEIIDRETNKLLSPFQ